MKNKARPPRTLRRQTSGIGMALAVTCAVPVPVYAVQFASENGIVTGSFDTTISYGTTFRVQSQDKKLLGLASTTLPNGTQPPGSLGGTAFSVNADNGNLNYDKGLVSNVVRIVPELELNHQAGFGLFARARAFYDFENEDNKREKIALTDEALEEVGSDIELLDAYVYGEFDAGKAPVELRVGDQVVSWGESTFIQNGINVINPIRVANIRTPGAEVREALLPEGMVWANIGIHDNHSLEMFYQYDWDDTEPDPSGSYFSTQDFVGRGGERVMLGFGQIPDIIPLGPAGAASVGQTPQGAVVPRGDDVNAKDSGQFGVAYRMFLEQLNSTELGFYFINYHSRLPIVSAVTGSLAGLGGGDYAGSARYFFEFPEDIKLLGTSFNTQLGTSGWALQGELSYKWDVPLQADDAELLFAALSPLALVGSPLGQLLAQTNQVAPGGVGFDTVVPGFIERDVVQAQATASRVFAGVWGADQLALIGELGVTHVQSMPDQSELRIESPGTFTSGNPIHTRAGVQPATEEASNFADATSAGYQIRGRFTYNNAIGPWALLPSFAFRHDFSGNTPQPLGNFLESRKAVTAGLSASLRNEWEATVSYTNFFGAGRVNLVNDRDFISFVIKYSK